MKDRSARYQKRNRPVPMTAKIHPSHGRPVDNGRLADRGVVGDGRPVDHLPVTRKEQPKKNCAGNDGTCKAWPVKGMTLCAGHQRQLDKSRTEVADTDDDSNRVD